MSVLGETTKRCSKCGKVYPATTEHFATNKKCKDKLDSWCRACKREYGRRYSQRPGAKEAHRKANREYYHNNREKIREQQKIHRNSSEDQERRRRADKRYYQTHRKQILEQQKIYRNSFKGRLKYIFGGMVYRTTNPKCKCYHQYGLRGIRVEFKDFSAFLYYVIQKMGITTIEQLTGMDFHRLDPDGNYKPGNLKLLSHGEHVALHNKLRKTG